MIASKSLDFILYFTTVLGSSLSLVFNDACTTEICYAFDNVDRTWTEAKDVCKADNGYLAEVRNQDEHNAVQSIVNKQTIWTGGPHEGIWLGGHDQVTEDTWVWDKSADALNRNTGFHKWEAGEPNNALNPPEGEDCLVMLTTGKWRDVSCDLTYTFVCQKENPCRPVDCNHGSCSPDTGAAVCTCEQEYQGTYCDQPTCAIVDCNHGVCDDSSGTAECACEEGYSGTFCDERNSSGLFQELVECFSAEDEAADKAGPVKHNVCHWLLPAVYVSIIALLVSLVVAKTINESRVEAAANKKQEEAELQEQRAMTRTLKRSGEYGTPPLAADPSALEDVDALTRRSRRHLAQRQAPGSRLPNVLLQHKRGAGPAPRDPRDPRDLTAHQSLGDVISHLWRNKPKGAMGHVWRRRLIRWWKHGY